MRWLRIGGAVIAGLLIAAVVHTAQADPAPPSMRTVLTPTPDPYWLDVNPTEDAGKPGTARSVMGQLILSQEPRTSGPSPDSLRFRFGAPVEVTGVVISVDIHGPQLVEVVASVNAEHPYGIEAPGDGRNQPFVARDWLLHTSDANDGGPSKIDEQISLPEPVELAAGDWVGISAWLGNTTITEQAVSPEVIVFYRWL